MTIYWDDEMESGNSGFNWGLLSNMCNGETYGQFDSVNKVSGNSSVQFNYPNITSDSCGSTFTDRYFDASTNPVDNLELWTRFYFRLSVGFDVDATQTKMWNWSTDILLSDWWGMLFDSTLLTIQVQRYPDNDNTWNAECNLGTTAQRDLKTSPEGGFRLVEARKVLNTVGSANGILEAWIDGVKVMEYTGLEFRKTSQETQNAKWQFCRMYRQDGNGKLNYDRLAFGDERIGAINGNGGGGISNVILMGQVSL